LKKNILLALVAFAALTFSCGAAEGVTVVNNTGFTIMEVSIAPATAEKWEFLDATGGWPIVDGGSFTFGEDLFSMGDEVRYNMRFKDEDGDYYLKQMVPWQIGLEFELTLSDMR
jgi:hypothetical protein